MSVQAKLIIDDPKGAARIKSAPVDVLVLVWATQGRDFPVQALTAAGLADLGLSVALAPIARFRRAVARYRPSVVFLAEGRGAKDINERAIRWLRARGVSVVTFVAEGIFRSDLPVELQVWGPIRDRIVAENVRAVWSTYARDLVLRSLPQLADKLVVTGAIGFDRYRILDIRGRRQLEQFVGRELGDRKIVGYAAWSFDRMDPDEPDAEVLRTIVGDDRFHRLPEEGRQVREELRKLIERFPDVLFLLKAHPSTRHPERTEWWGLDQYENVVLVRNELPIDACLDASDAWMAYESTTCLEAWLLGKPTLLLNPNGGDFPRVKLLAEGSPILKNADECARFLEDVFNGKTPTAFTDRAPKREAAIRRFIQWGDGLNHRRAAMIIDAVLRATPDRPTHRYARLDAWFERLYLALVPRKRNRVRKQIEALYDPSEARAFLERVREVTDWPDADELARVNEPWLSCHPEWTLRRPDAQGGHGS